MSRLLRVAMLLAIAALGQAAIATPVLEVRISGNVTVGPESVLEAVKLIVHPGQELLDPARTMSDIESAVARLGYFDEVKASYTPTDAGYVVVIAVKERPRATAVTLEGNVTIPTTSLAPTLGTQVGRFLDAGVLRRDAERILEAYENIGMMASVTDVKVADDGKVVFIIHEATLESVEMVGLRVITQQEALEKLGIANGSLYQERQVGEAIARLRKVGWFARLSARVIPGKTNPEGALVLQVTVDEAPGIFPDRVGKPVSPVNIVGLREEVGALPMDIEYSAAIRINGYLLDLTGDIRQVLPQLRAAAAQVNPASTDVKDAETVYDCARALEAVGHAVESAQHYQTAAMMYSQLVQGDSTKVEEVIRLADSLVALGESGQAVEVLRRAAQVAPDDWRPRTKLAVAAANHLLQVYGQEMVAQGNPGNVGEARTVPSLVAVVELLPWDHTREAMLGQLDPPAANDPLVALAREARSNLLDGLKLAKGDAHAWRDAFEVSGDAFFATAGLFDCVPSIWQAVSEDVGATVAQVGAVAEQDPGVALWTAFSQSFHAVLVLSGAARSPLPTEMINSEFSALGKRLDEIQTKWPSTLAASGGLVGIVQFLAGKDAEARKSFEQLLQADPFDRGAYNALLGMAYSAEDWEWMKTVVNQRLAASPAPEDYVILAKIAERQKKPEEALAALRSGEVAFPNEALTHLDTAAWLISTSGDAAEAEALIAKGLELNPASGYALSLRCALRLTQARPDEATADLAAALKMQPRDDLANILRNRFFAM